VQTAHCGLSPETSPEVDQCRPWHAVGVIGPDKAPPYNFPRSEIEKAIEIRFQLWRMKGKAD
jgi:hypothetical protein